MKEKIDAKITKPKSDGCPKCKDKGETVWFDGQNYYHDDCDLCDGTGRRSKDGFRPKSI